MSPNGQDDGDRCGPSALIIDLAGDDRLDWHSHDAHQLAWAAQGTLILALADASWVLPRSRAAWIPAGTRHAVTVSGDTRLLSIYVEPSTMARSYSSPMVVDALGLLGQLVHHLSRGDLGGPERSRAEALLADLLLPLPVAAVPLPMPSDDRVRRVADDLLADVTDRRSLEQWGRLTGASARTLARLFATETGMGFAKWRTNARLVRALPRLAAGVSVSRVAAEVGYSSSSAFVAAFRRELGTAPAHYFGRGTPA